MDNLPLSKLKVLDLTIARAGPTAVRLLSDWGADVIRIDTPKSIHSNGSVTGSHDGSDHQNLHRNKRSLAINLKTNEGQAILKKMLVKTDIVVENFRREVKERLGIDYESLKAINKRVILASISGFGQSGPYADRPGVDQIVQGLSGLMSITGEPKQGPMRTGIAISDTSAGMFLGQGILLALLHRERTGEGQWVHTSLLESMLCKLDFQGSRYTMEGEIPEQQGNFHPTQVPMGVFEAKDGYVNLAASTTKMWRNFCECLKADKLLNNQSYSTSSLRLKNRLLLNEDIANLVKEFTKEFLVAELNKVGVPCGPIYNVGEAFEDKQSKHLQITKTAHHPSLGDVKLVRSPINLSACELPKNFHHAGPSPGEQSIEILKEFDITDTEIKQLMEQGVIT